MRIAFVTAAGAAMLAGCGGGGSSPPTPAPTASATSAPAPAATRGIGTVSGLTGQTSALTGTISGFAVEKTDFGTRVALAADTLFDFDKATLTPAAEENLRRAADAVRGGGAGTVTINGYTDAKGEDVYNLDLSKRRAEAVAAWLRAQPGLGGRDYQAVGLGENDPVAPNEAADGSDDPAGRARNRRVTIDIPR
ncbi:OmpA family protein [Sphingomonas corticis]|jgi:outer membrane protein OmpA-like peptidoglycan-associated protein|uniref:OmpA family protein n=1 Tax=Sphingomonas corticis TaxID=2722791 RepID=A0ABX1CLL5_9SPHN|nr:OmpA family protein [Sphingomonas corticis]NJR77813.1 OmpA family protein [Sphingomonas corticis]